MARFKTNVQEDLRKRICQFRKNHINKPLKFTVDHFLAEQVPRSTIYRVLERFANNIGPERKKGSSRKAKKMDKKNINKLKKMFDKHDGISQRQAARKFNTVQSHISSTLQHKTNIRYYKKKKIPSRTDSQIARIKPLCRHLYRNFRNLEWILDDESYFTFGNTTLSGNDGFYSSDVSATPSDVKYAAKKKYEEKLLVSLIISPKGISKPLFSKSKQAVNNHVYMSYLHKRLLPFINEHHKNGHYLFWPDLASSHYAKDVIAFLETENINYVPKVKNPPNVPEARPIEDFWAVLKRAVYAGNWQAKSIPQLKGRIEYCIKKMDPEVAKRYARETSVRLGKIAFNNVIEKQ
jgi:hypothetical protein